jgi:hypothetical protein
LLTPYGLFGTSGCDSVSASSALVYAGALERPEQVVRGADVGRQRRLGRVPRPADVRSTGAVVDRGRAQPRDRRGDRVGVEQVHRLPAGRADVARRRMPGAMPGDHVGAAVDEAIDQVAAREPGRARNKDFARHGRGARWR